MMKLDTEKRIQAVFDQALNIFKEKIIDYGAAWLGFSPSGFADQIYIKAHRYKTLIYEKQKKVSDPPELELYAIINYGIIFLMTRNKQNLAKIFDSPTALFEPVSPSALQMLEACYKGELCKVLELKNRKDHDYGSAWQNLSEEGLADIILSKTLRLKKMLSFGKKVFDDDDPNGIVATLRDLVNYSAFALVLRQS